MNTFRDHIDPGKEDQLKEIIVETDTKVERIMKLVRGANSGNREAKQKKKAEAISLIEDFHKQYQSICALYEDLREGVKRKCKKNEDKEDNESTNSSSCSLSMESSAFLSPRSGSKTPSLDQQKATIDGQSMKPETSCYSLEDTSEIVKETFLAEPYSRNKLCERDKKYQNFDKIEVLEDRVAALKLELEALNSQNSEYEVEYKGRHDDFHRRTKRNPGFRYRVSDIEMAFKEQEGYVLKKLDDCEKILKGKIGQSMDQVLSLQIEVESLRSQNLLNNKEKELESLRNQSKESEMELKKKTTNEEGLVEEINSLQKRVKDLEVKISTISEEVHLSKYENETQRKTISQLAEKLQEKQDQISTLESKTEGVKRDLSNKIKSLEHKFKSLEIDKRELEEKNDVLATTLKQRDMLVSKINHDAKSSFRTTVKEMGEMVDEFRKKSEDSIRLLSRRIRVAEQLHNETREWYKKTQEKHGQDKKDNELAFRSIKIITSMVNDALSASETLGLRFTECCEDFTNRVSKVSCEMNFVKDWAKIKNGNMAKLEADFDALVVQLHVKEEEILGSRQKVLKLENKLRDLEKIVKENDEALIVLKEEKREAIRQLCVWIDYHRSQSDSLRKAFCDLVVRNRRPT
ncbi:protein Networked (NET), actin-binding (NAB) domain-containing protein [Artemisia annua]|uniref:Protein Networked (NET), actin-binding (NAB) domain-containing protein n=1 Tax=Artemisia annua TaxID=35608 RepID=A0A2U1QMN8_ARTAN|nr:protein Networked (NET), actin-binding (NAB) domain-containing protein [Artemisia annua]